MTNEKKPTTVTNASLSLSSPTSKSNAINIKVSSPTNESPTTAAAANNANSSLLSSKDQLNRTRNLSAGSKSRTPKIVKDDYDATNKSRCGFFRKAIPIMPKSLAIVCCIMNILFPGLGTFVSSFSIFFCATHNYETNLKAFLINMLAFLMQLLSAIIIFGWIWSIKYGLLFVHLADKTENIDGIEPDLPLFVRRHSSMETNMNMYNLAKPRLSAIALAKVNEDEPA